MNTTDTADNPISSINGLVAILAIGILLAMLAAMLLPQELPTIDQVVPQPHAVERHGADALAAREMLYKCGEGLRSRLCPEKPGTYGRTVNVWCETGLHLCPGCYTTVGGIEKTAFIRPCEEWRECR